MAESFKDDNGVVDFKDFKKTLEQFEIDQIDYLFDVEPQSQNLFWVGHFTQGNDLKTFYNSQFRVRNIKLPDLTYEIDNNDLTKALQFKSVTYDRKVQISWFEDVYHSVYKYHTDWANRWYNKDLDILRCGVNGKFRKLDLVAYHRKNSANENSIIETPEIEPILVFEITGMAPINIPGMMFDYERDGNDELLTINYACSKIRLLYSKDLASGAGTNANLYKTGDEGSSVASNKGVWSPKGIVETEVGDDATGREGLRIARALSTSYKDFLT